MQAEYRFTFSEDHLLTAFLRYRQQIWWLRPFVQFKWILGAFFVVVVFIAARQRIPPLAILGGGMAGSLLLGGPINSWLMRRRFRKSPFHDDPIVFVLSEQGTHATGRGGETRTLWTTYTRARQFKDGLLLLQGPGLFVWLPDAAAEGPASKDGALALARAHVKDFGGA